MSQRRADKNARRKRRKQRPDGQRQLRAGGPGAAGDIPPELDGPGSVVQMVRDACDDPHPLGLLCGVSSLMSSLDPRVGDALSRDEPRPRLAELTDAFLYLGAWETDVLCRVIAHLTTDAGVARKIRTVLSDRPQMGPAWSHDLGEMEVTGAAMTTDALRDSDDVVLEVSLPGGHRATLITLVDHNLNGAVKDSFAAPVTLADFLEKMQEWDESQFVSSAALDAADARAILESAIEASLRMWPAPESESWPQSLALLEHVVGLLPAGGTGYPDWVEDADRASARDFLASPEWQWPKEGAEADAAGLLTWIQNGFIGRGPERVSPVTVEIVMEDLWLRKTEGLSEEAKRTLPDVLRAWTRFVHRRHGIPDELTVETLGAIDSRTPGLLEALKQGTTTPGVADIVAEHLRQRAGRDDG